MQETIGFALLLTTVAVLIVSVASCENKLNANQHTIIMKCIEQGKEVQLGTNNRPMGCK
jgi:hypothetical protein